MIRIYASLSIFLFLSILDKRLDIRTWHPLYTKGVDETLLSC